MDRFIFAIAMAVCKWSKRNIIFVISFYVKSLEYYYSYFFLIFFSVINNNNVVLRLHKIW